MTKDWTHLFANYRGQWVALADDELTVLAAGATAKDALAWWNAQPQDRRAQKRPGIEPDRETALLEAWHKAHG